MKLKILLALFILSNHVFAQVIDPRKLDVYLDSIERTGLGVGSIAIYQNGKQAYSRSFGQKNIPGLSANGGLRYHVGSVTKLLTATLIFRLVDQGSLSLDTRLSEFFPEVPNASKITIGNLLDHTSGLGSYVVRDGEVWVTEQRDPKQLMDLIIKQGVAFEPNQKVAYSNSAYYLLTAILEKIHGKPYHRILEKEITGPLALKDLLSATSKPKNVALPYRYENGSWSQLDEEIVFSNVIGVGDVVATPQSMNMFINYLFNGKVISANSLALMLPVIGREEWGKGIAIWDFDGKIYFGHGGDTLGSHALLLYNRDADISIAYVTNGERIKKEDFIKPLVSLLYEGGLHVPKRK